MTYVVDIDGTICEKAPENDYTKALPFLDRIEAINQLHDNGHTIIYFTARGMGRHNNDASKAIEQFYDLTKDQLSSWGAKYHTLMLGKPAGDFYIDDKGISAHVYFE
jgi:hydroxymethylpyrimidine pyrophosphatase-like HAD family hydrolase